MGTRPCPHPLTKGTGAREVAVPRGQGLGEQREDSGVLFKHAPFVTIKSNKSRVDRLEVTVTLMLRLDCAASSTVPHLWRWLLFVFFCIFFVTLFSYPLDLHASPTKKKHTPPALAAAEGWGEGAAQPLGRLGTGQLWGS